MLRYLLVFVAGALLGANVAWYYATSRATVAPTSATAPPARAQPTVHPDAVRAATAPADPHPDTSPTPAVRPATGASGMAPPSAAPVRAPSGLVIPVQGIRPDQLVDTYTQSRGAGRLHEAIDIMAPAGTPVLAAIEGPVAKLFTSERGGITVYQFDPEGRRVYYYAHLQGYAPGLAEGQVLRQGQVLGYVGSTGSATPDGPHLHFSIGELTPEKKWHRSVAMNPYPLLAGAGTR
ncbi:M23 family metallopeptidase [Lysobacter humi (ex Lee et al. 2017)]